MKSIYFFYEYLPIILQNYICTLYGYVEKRKRFNSIFKSYLDNFISSDFSSKYTIKTQKKKLLSNTLINAKKSSYYLLKNISDKKIKEDPFSILSNMPILTKELLISHIDELTITTIKSTISHTSGTTGKALSFYRDNNSSAAQWAIWFRHRKRFGVNLGDLSVNFTGKPVVPMKQNKPPYWRYNASQNQFLIGMQHINEQSIDSIVDFLNNIQPVFYSGYPSILSEIARLAIYNNLSLKLKNRPKFVFTGAENLLQDQKKYINKWIGSTIRDQYGLTEGNCNFSTCEHGNYHEDYEFSHIEVIDYTLLPDGSKKGRLIGTSFYNYATPLIRYDTGDIVTVMPDEYICPCGRHTKVIAFVDGRVDDYILTPDGKHVMRFDYLFKDTKDIYEAQVVQEREGQIIIYSVKRENFDQEKYELIVLSQFHKYISREMELVFIYVDAIEKSSRGKFKAVINKMVNK